MHHGGRKGEVARGGVKRMWENNFIDNCITGRQGIPVEYVPAGH